MAEEAQQTMTPHLTRPPWSRRARALVALMALALFASVLSGSAMASPGSGEVSLSLKPGSSLLKQGVKVTYSAKAGKTGATKRLARKGKAGATVAIAIEDVVLGPPAVLGSPGVLTFAKGGDEVSASDLEVRVGAKGTSVSGKLGGKSLTVFRAEGAPTTDATSVKLSNAKLSLTGKAARELRDRFDNDRVSSGRVGSAAVSAAVTPEPKKAGEPGKKIDDGGLIDPYPYASQCPVKKVTGPAIGEAPGQVAGIAAGPAFNAGTSQPVTGTSIEWGFYQSFRNYVLNVPTAGSLQTLDGATASAAGAAMAGPTAFFDFPVGGGTYEPGTEPSHSDDKLVASGTGTVLFCKSGHGFNVVLKNPTVTIDGANSRITADVGVNQHGTWYPFQRVDIATLNLSSVQPTVSGGGNTIVWDDIPVTLSADGAKATGLGDQYPAGTVLDTITVKTSLDRPLLTQCGVDAGTVSSPPTVNFALAALPTLTTPVIRSGKNLGTINWGFRRSTRATVASPGGSFVMLGGATESFPGSMGGANSAPPAGGIGKFFRFPISSYSYEAGTASPSDDRLIATSNATVGFCKPKTMSGNFGLIISKPTLVIDGANSRIVANVYSFAGPFAADSAKGWIGGRVDLVKLNAVGFNTTTGVGTVRWGEVNPDLEPMQPANNIPVDGQILTEALSLASLTIAGTTPPATPGFDPVAAQIVLP